MRALILGYAASRLSDQSVEGLVMYYAAKNDLTSGLYATCYYVDAEYDASVCDLIMSVDLSQPVWADLTFGLRADDIYHIVDIVFEEKGSKKS